MCADIPYTITVIADYGPLSDMAFSEVTLNLYKQMEGIRVRVKEYSVPVFDTVQTGFMLAQTAINSELADKHLFFVNTAPRHDDAKPRSDSAGEKLVYLKLKNGVRIIGVNSGHSMSFVKDLADEIRVLEVANEGSQFRSRDFYPSILTDIAKGDNSAILDKEPTIADVPENIVGFVDGYGNLKCNISPKAVDAYMGEYLAVEINGYRHFVRVGQSIFDVPDGYLCMAKGSSGWDLPGGERREFIEIVRRSGNAFKDFGKPDGGATVSFEKI